MKAQIKAIAKSQNPEAIINTLKSAKKDYNKAKKALKSVGIKLPKEEKEVMNLINTVIEAAEVAIQVAKLAKKASKVIGKLWK